MIPIPASILAIENESDRDFMENIFFSYQRLIYHEIGSILNDPWSKDDIFQTVIVQLINNIDTLRPMPAKVLTSYIATSARNAALTYIRNISRRKEILADEFDNSNVDDDHDSDPEVILLKSEEINSFAKIWDELDDKTKFLLSSRYILEKSYAEIASDLNVKPGKRAYGADPAQGGPLWHFLKKARYNFLLIFQHAFSDCNWQKQ